MCIRDSTDDGTLYMFPFVRDVCLSEETMGLNFTQGPIYRLDWAEQLGIDPPQPIEDWSEMLCAFRDNDMNGNGDPNDEKMCIRDRCVDSGTGIQFPVGLPDKVQSDEKRQNVGCREGIKQPVQTKEDGKNNRQGDAEDHLARQGHQRGSHGFAQRLQVDERAFVDGCQVCAHILHGRHRNHQGDLRKEARDDQGEKASDQFCPKGETWLLYTSSPHAAPGW